LIEVFIFLGRFYLFKGGKVENLLTKEGYLKIKEELNYLKKVKRNEVAEKIKDSLEYGDTAENSELEYAKDEQAFLEARIGQLEYLIKNAKIISNHSKNSRVKAGCRVVVISQEQKSEYTLVGSAETDPAAGKISLDSPLGRAIFGKTKGEKVSIDTISGPIQYKIVDIK